MLNSLPESYKDLKAAIKYGRESLSLEDVLGALRSRDLEIKFEKKGTTEGLNVRGRSQKRNHSLNRGKSRSKSRGQPQNTRGKACWFCKNEGHIRRFCPDRKKTLENNFEKVSNANVSEGFSKAVVLTVSNMEAYDDWVMDSGCTFHMTPNKEWLFDFKPINGGMVLMGNDHSCNVTGFGSIRFKMWDDTYKILENVRLVPDLRRNLISLGMLDSTGCSYKSVNVVLKVMKGSMVILKGLLRQGMYVLQGKAVAGDSATIITCLDHTRLWHNRLGHISMKGLEQLCKQGIVDSKGISSMDFCETCILGKSHRLKFATTTHSSKGILEYVHFDLWGSPKVPTSLNDSHYFVLLLMIILEEFGSIS